MCELSVMKEQRVSTQASMASGRTVDQPDILNAFRDICWAEDSGRKLNPVSLA